MEILKPQLRSIFQKIPEGIDPGLVEVCQLCPPSACCLLFRSLVESCYPPPKCVYMDFVGCHSGGKWDGELLVSVARMMLDSLQKKATHMLLDSQGGEKSMAN